MIVPSKIYHTAQAVFDDERDVQNFIVGTVAQIRELGGEKAEKNFSAQAAFANAQVSICSSFLKGEIDIGDDFQSGLQKSSREIQAAYLSFP